MDFTIIYSQDGLYLQTQDNIIRGPISYNIQEKGTLSNLIIEEYERVQQPIQLKIKSGLFDSVIRLFLGETEKVKQAQRITRILNQKPINES